jgi:hypothetical protein
VCIYIYTIIYIYIYKDFLKLYCIVIVAPVSAVAADDLTQVFTQRLRRRASDSDLGCSVKCRLTIELLTSMSITNNTITNMGMHLIYIYISIMDIMVI